MTSARRRWNEEGLSETPAVELLQKLGYEYVAPEVLEAERASLREVVLVGRLEAALRRLNPWISDDNVHKAVRAVTNIQAASLIEANEKAYTALTYGIALEQDLGGGRQSRQVRFFDFDEPEQNEFVVTRQFEVKGAKKKIIPDVMIFVNGIPLVIIECKSPTIGEGWFQEAFEQLERYQEGAEKWRELGAPRLFHTMQLAIVTCDQAASVGTVRTPKRFFSEWKRPWPWTVEQVGRELGRSTPSPQDVLFFGTLSKGNLLDIVRNFVVFERDASTGRTIKKIPRYQQLAAVNTAIERSQRAKEATERGGVVWHTQGSGKSLTMLWLALKLRRDPMHENPTIVIVTDRQDLDRQITGTFRACGFPNPKRAESIKAMRKLLSGATGATVMTTVQKFQEVGGIQGGGGAAGGRGKGKRLKKPVHEVLSEASNVFVMTDEAHRTQYGSLAANLRQALPNAVFFGFTGTPIDKKDRSTLTTFGPYIDQYTIEQAVADGATVPIFYESRLPELRIVGQSLDRVFDRVFADRNEEEREAIKKKYATEKAVAEAPKRIEAIALDLLDHYTQYIQPNGFKAQIVAVSRDAAATYKEMLDRLHAPQSAVVYSSSNKDEERLAKHHTSKEDRDALVSRFIKPEDPLQILIVRDMLLTGFDAPIEQVMYLDSPLREHTLLQAIARVNRTAEMKDYGLVVDYWGVSEALQEALAVFSPSDVKGAMEPKVDELPRLQTRHAAALRFFVRVKQKDDLDECLKVLEAEDVRAEFQTAFRRFSQSMDMMLPDPKALAYADDLRWLGKVRQAARARFRDESLDISDCGDKVRKLIEEAVVADGVEILVKQVSLFSGDFDRKLGALKSDEAKASEMEHAIKHEIHVKLEENPAFYQSLRERLQQIIEDRKARRIDAAEQLELLQHLVEELRKPEQAAGELGLTETGFAIYGVLGGDGVSGAAQGGSMVAEGGTPYGEIDTTKKALAEAIEEEAAQYLRIVDWQRKDDVQREMRRKFKRLFDIQGQYTMEEKNRLAASVIDLLKARRA